MLQCLRKVDFLPARLPGVPDCFLSIAGPGSPTLVAIHGISRNAAELATRFAQHPAFQDVNIVAPLFERERFGKYQQLLARRPGETPSDEGLFALLADLASRKGLAQGKMLLFGFSGGAQMAHRVMMLHPERVDRLCVASAGWYLLPDPDLPYPYGFGEGCPVAASGSAYLDVPTTVIVGDRDIRIDEAVCQDAMIVSRQGRNRLQRARAWIALLADRSRALGRAPRARLVTLESGTHDFGACAREAGLIDRAAEALLI
jgi:pimeloyl-ACP methyl ester carboxylesterase